MRRHRAQIFNDMSGLSREKEGNYAAEGGRRRLFLYRVTHKDAFWVELFFT